MSKKRWKWIHENDRWKVRHSKKTYWESVGYDESGEGQENPCGNPDVLTDEPENLFYPPTLSIAEAMLIRKSLECLTKRQQQVIELGYYRNWSLRRIAKKLKVSVQSVCENRKAAFKKMRLYLEEEGL